MTSASFLITNPQSVLTENPDLKESVCWWCCHEIPDGQLLRLPYKHDPQRDRFLLMGAFCSWGCMKTFNLDRNGVNHGGIVCQNILLYRKKLCGTRYSLGVQCAPNRFALKMFGGDMSIEEFRSYGSGEKMIHLPDEFKPCQILEKPKYEMKSTPQETKMQEIQNSTTSNETLKLKRTKPLKRDTGNTLEKSLGLKRSKKADLGTK
jgi:hypothetical protein